MISPGIKVLGVSPVLGKLRLTQELEAFEGMEQQDGNLTEQRSSPSPTPVLPVSRFILPPKYLIIGAELLVALPLSFLLAHLGLGGIAWIFGGIASGAFVLQASREFYSYVAQPNRSARKVGQALVGFTIGCSLVQTQLAGISSDLPVFVMLTLLILLSGSAIGLLYARLSQTNLLTAMLATVPGGIGVMASIAADYGRNVTQVALVQVIRITTVILFIPLVAKSFAGDFLVAHEPESTPLLNLDPSYLGTLLLGLGVAIAGIYLSSRLRIPAAPFFGSLVAGIAFNPLLHSLPWMTDILFTPPPLENLLGNVLLGITIGEYWGTGAKLKKRAIAHALIPVVLTIAIGFLVARLAMALTGWDWLTCLLVTAPGGAPEMILVSLALHHSVETVTAGHLVRLMAINASLPLWVFWFRSLDRYLPYSTSESHGQSLQSSMPQS